MTDQDPTEDQPIETPLAPAVVSNTSTELNSEMRNAYLDYAMTVIVSRALPDARDGLKPVHRRILFAMHKMGLTFGGRFNKSAGIVGEVLGKYHPHGDAPVYEALVRMAQDFSMRYPLIKGQGNFGSIDGDPAAAMRYTEVKLAKIAEEMLVDIEKETVGFIDNFDGRLQEPLYLPAKLPNLLLMGAEGIAVGMATKIPPHNLTEIVDATIALIDTAKLINPEEKDPTTATTVVPKDDPNTNESAPYEKIYGIYAQKDLVTYEASIEDLLEFVKGPDFPTAGIIYGASDIKQVYATGRGKILIRAVADEEEMKNGRSSIVVTQLPYQVNKANLVEKIAHLVVDKKIVGISDLRDESDRDGIRVVIELKKDASYKKVLNNLFKFTELQTSFPVNVVALVDGVPQTLSLKTILEVYLKHRVDIVTKRSEYELKQAKHRAHILEGYLIALDHIDEVIKIIRGSKDEPTAKAALMKNFGLSEIQTQAIMEMQLRRLTGLERSKIEDELKTLQELINYLEDLLSDVFKVLKVIKDELLYLREKYGDERRTKVMKSKPGEISDEELIENKDVFVVLTKEGYIKQIPTETFKVQNRGGKGVSGMETKDTDNICIMTKAKMHDFILYFSNQGRVFTTRVWDIPAGSRTSKGKAIVNVLTLRPDEKVTSILTYNPESFKSASTDDKLTHFVIMITKNGTVKKTPFQEYANIRSNGLIAIKLEEGDALEWVKLTHGTKNVMLISKNGKAIMFKEAEVRTTGRSSIGVKGIEMDDTDQVVSADVFEANDIKKDIFVISDKGIGKKTQLTEFKGQHRGGKGVKIASLDEKFGKIAFVEIIDPGENTVIITSGHGQVVKIPLVSIPSRSRTAKGVILMRFTDKADRVVSATFVE